MKRTIALLLAMLSLFALAACGETPEAAPTGAPAETAAPSEIPIEPAPEIPTATAEELSLAGLETVEEVRAYLDTVLPRGRDEVLIPYVADIYHAGENTLTWMLFGFCTRDGEIVTKPVFRSVEPVRELLSDWPDPETLYLCFFPSDGMDGALYTTSGEHADGRRYEAIPCPDDFVFGGVGELVDDGVYCVEGYEDARPGGRYDIVRKSDGVKVAETEAPCWPGLWSCDLGNGDRIYYTLLDGICTTYDRDFTPILRVPALGSWSIELFTAAPAETGAMPVPETVEPLPLSAQRQYEANLFLSNFSEQGFGQRPGAGTFVSSEASVAQLFSWAKINKRSAISYEGNYEVMTREDYVDIVRRYFDLDAVPEPAEGADFSAEFGMGRYDWDHCWYENGRFYYPAADGESHTCFSVADSAETADGRYTRFRFTIYALDLQIYWDNNGIPDAYYHLTPSEAAARVAAGEISLVGTGTADAGTFYLESSGRQSWRLLRYAPD